MRIEKILLSALCAILLFSSCKDASTQSVTSNSPPTQTEAKQTQEENEPESTEPETPETPETPEDPEASQTPEPSEPEKGEDDGGDEKETPVTHTVRFYSPEGEIVEEVTVEAGASLTKNDIPTVERTGYRCVWTLPSEPLTDDVDCYSAWYKEIATATDFLRIGESERCILTQNISFANTAYTVDGETGALIPFFSGELDGNGYTISDLILSGEAKSVFGVLENAALYNITVENIRFDGRANLLDERFANGCAFIQTVKGQTKIRDCDFAIDFQAKAKTTFSAGLVYALEAGEISNTRLTVTTPSDDSSTDGVYGVCVYKSERVSLDGVVLVAAPTIQKSFSIIE